MYQLRLKDGTIREFESLKELAEVFKNTLGTEIEKVSFNAEDGTRIRLVWDYGFTLTFWNGEEYQEVY